MKDRRLPGRPRKPADKKPEQFSIRLQPTIKFGLELLARIRGVSLSQACEYALAKTLRSEEFKGSPLIDIAEAAMSLTDKAGQPLVIHVDMRILTALRLPEELRSPEEKYVLGVYTAIRPKNQVNAVPDFYAMAAECFSVGMPQREAISELAEWIAEQYREQQR